MCLLKLILFFLLGLFSLSAVAHGYSLEALFGTNPDRQQANTKDEDPTGLLNEGFRYRDLKTGTFITRDPLGMVDGPNVYTYVNQNPWSKFDPLGLKEVIATPEDTKGLVDAAPIINQAVNNLIRRSLSEASSGKEAQDIAKAYIDQGSSFGGNDTALVKYLQKSNPEIFTQTKTEGTKFEGAFTHAFGGGYEDSQVLAQAMNVDGNVVGTDKLDHMFYDGYGYKDMTESSARSESVRAEKQESGMMMTGVKSMADFEANMVGRDFYNKLKDAYDGGKDYTFDIRDYDLSLLDESKNKNTYANRVIETINKNEAKQNKKDEKRD